jgi:hypothetical protein
MNVLKRLLSLRHLLTGSTCKIISLLVILVTFFFVLLTVQEVWQPFSLHQLPDIHPSIPAGLPSKNFPDRKWLHRVDSIERVRYADTLYTGIEIDVSFDEEKQVFDVSHTFAISIGLSLDTLIAEITNSRQHFYWIDFKNLTGDNKKAAVKELYRIARKYDIVSNIIVESSNPRELDEFSYRGFYTSYYLPDIDPGHLSEEDMKAHIRNIASHLSNSKVHAISSNHKQYEIIKKYFSGYDILLWNFTDNPLARKLRENKLLKDPQVKVLLIEDTSHEYK